MRVPLPPADRSDDAWQAAPCRALMEELWALRGAMLASEHLLQARINAAAPGHRPGARNLAHYLALRREDRRALQDRLASAGLSSLGMAESHVLANLDKVLGLLHRLVGEPWQDRSCDEPVGLHGARAGLDLHATALLGPAPVGRAVRIMVTLPSEAAHDPVLVQSLVDAGMDVARINCAHDGAPEWQAMARHVRQAAQQSGRTVRVLMDLAGPKLRTGPVSEGPSVLKLKPGRDLLGRVHTPVRVGLRPAGSHLDVPDAEVQIGVAMGWLQGLEEGETVHLVDARGANRRLEVVRRGAGSALAQTEQTLYLVPETRLERHSRNRDLDGEHSRVTPVFDLPRAPGRIPLDRGDFLRLVRHGVAQGGQPWQGPDEVGDGTRDAIAEEAVTPWIACTLPEVFAQVRPGERVGLDDGRMMGVIRDVGEDALRIEITQVRPGGDHLAGDKGINLPDSDLCLPALTDKDRQDLHTVAACADLVGFSFVQSEQDVGQLHEALRGLGAEHLGVLLKIETRQAFERLPELLFAAMAGPAAGVMIARGDLAVECGYERLAEVQEELLWAAEAAHLPVVWATQVLETLAKTGRPSRAEVTDAAMGDRAECVMLNKGPHILQAMQTLDDILRRMQDHQHKKRPLLRALHAWVD